MSVEDFERRLSRIERQIERDIGQARALRDAHRQYEAEALELEERAEALEEAIGVMNSFADAKQAEIQNKIEALVTHGLQTIFGDEDMRFAMIREEKSRRTEIRFVVRTLVDGQELETSIMDARGGGVAAVAGFLLRLIVTLLRKDTSNFLLLDETFGQLSKEYTLAMADFLAELTVKTSAQIVLVTHQPEFAAAADRAYKFTLGSDGRTQVKSLAE